MAGLQVLHWMGEPVSQYGDVWRSGPICPDHAAGLAFIAGARRAILLRRCAPMPSSRRFCASSYLRRLAAAERPSSILPARPILPATSSATAPRLTQNRRRLLRRLEERGAVVVERHTGGAASPRAAALESHRSQARLARDHQPPVARRWRTALFAFSPTLPKAGAAGAG